MNWYSWEHEMRGRHRDMVRAAEQRSRLSPDEPQAPFADRLAVRLRLLADRLDGRTSLTVVSGSR